MSNNRYGGNEFSRPWITLWVSAAILLVFFVWAAFSEIEQVTRAPGQVIASSRSQVIQSYDGGVLNEMLVKEGDLVAKGQPLARMDRTKAETLFLESRAKLAALSAATSRLQAEIFGGDIKFTDAVASYPQFRQNQTLLLSKRRAAFREEIESLQQMQALARRELAMTEPLLSRGDVSMVDVLKLQRQVADLQAQITNRSNKYLQDTQAEFAKVSEDLAGAEQLLAQRKDVLNNVEINAPVNGVVKNVRITTLGGVIKPGEEIMQIVPLEDKLVIEAKVKPADIAFLKPGLTANVKIDAYDYTIYGSLNGKLTYISADTLTEDLKQGEQAYYRVQVETQTRKFSAHTAENLEIQPGMTATVEIKTGSNTVLRYLLKPVIKTMNESLGER
jgi:membrane fusion protein, adhesin transport system